MRIAGIKIERHFVNHIKKERTMIRNILLLMIMMSIAIGCQDQEEKKKQESDLSKENKQLTEKLNLAQKRNDRLETVIIED